MVRSRSEQPYREGQATRCRFRARAGVVRETAARGSLGNA